jgi:hypothetical protein
MDVMATRGWGLAVSGAMIVIALAVAFTAPQQRASSQGAETRAANSGVTARVETTPAPRTLVVHFRGRGPLARAERARSQRRISVELSRQRAFRGLCFAHFAQDRVVLRACDNGMLTEWMPRLRAMRAVASVERGE